jgi:hypothetical protein
MCQASPPLSEAPSRPWLDSRPWDIHTSKRPLSGDCGEPPATLRHGVHDCAYHFEQLAWSTAPPGTRVRVEFCKPRCRLAQLGPRCGGRSAATPNRRSTRTGPGQAPIHSNRAANWRVPSTCSSCRRPFSLTMGGVTGQTGAAPAQALERWVDSVLISNSRGRLAAAIRVLAEGTRSVTRAGRRRETPFATDERAELSARARWF